VLHVAAAQLDDVRVAGHQRHVLHRQRLGNDQQAKLVGDVAQNFQPLFTQPLEAVG
jgi:hypothetical protein